MSGSFGEHDGIAEQIAGFNRGAFMEAIRAAEVLINRRRERYRDAAAASKEAAAATREALRAEAAVSLAKLKPTLTERWQNRAGLEEMAGKFAEAMSWEGVDRRFDSYARHIRETAERTHGHDLLMEYEHHRGSMGLRRLADPIPGQEPAGAVSYMHDDYNRIKGRPVPSWPLDAVAGKLAAQTNAGVAARAAARPQKGPGTAPGVPGPGQDPKGAAAAQKASQEAKPVPVQEGKKITDWDSGVRRAAREAALRERGLSEEQIAGAMAADRNRSTPGGVAQKKKPKAVTVEELVRVRAAAAERTRDPGLDL